MSVKILKEIFLLQIKLPFKSEHGILNDNFLLCKSWLKNLFNDKLRKDRSLFKRYDEIIKNQIESRIIENAPESTVGEIYYIPHKPVVCTAHKMRFTIKDFFSKCDQIRSSHLLKKSSMENFIFCAVAKIKRYNKIMNSVLTRVLTQMKVTV